MNLMATIRFIHALTNGNNDIVGSNGPDTISGQAVHTIYTVVEMQMMALNVMT
jgi:hypothetical protein